MPRKKQQCGFRIPWISGSSSESHYTHTKQKSKSPSSHRPPFRPPGIASTPPQPPLPQVTPKTEPQKVSKSLPSHSPAPSVIIDFPVSSEPNVKELELELELDSTHTENSGSNSNAPLETKSNANNNIKRGPSIPRPKKWELDETGDKKQRMMFATSTPSSEQIKVVTPASTISLSNEENSTAQKNMNDNDISALNPTLNMDDKTVSVVTLAGDNRGVTMHVAGSHRPKPEGKSSSSSSSSSTEKKEEAGKTYVNSNIQSINNSIMSHGSISGRDPGVHVIHPQHPQPQVQTPKAQVSINKPERVPYPPVVRRRCLRGLLLESSDSDPDNPHKPLRHGCKVRCGDNTKDKDVLTK